MLVIAVLAVSCGERARQPAVDIAPQVADASVGPLPGLEEAVEGEPNPFTGDETALREGRRFFTQYNCAGCHGDHGGGGMGPSLRDEVWLYGSRDAQIANSIEEGRANGMPAWGIRLTRSQIWQLVAYLKSLRTEHEPDPPR